MTYCSTGALVSFLALTVRVGRPARVSSQIMASAPFHPERRRPWTGYVDTADSTGGVGAGAEIGLMR